MQSTRVFPILKPLVFIILLLAVCVALYLQPNEIRAFQFSKLGTTVTETHFVSRDTNIKMTAPWGARIYYSTDGSTPDENSEEYTEPIVLTPRSDAFPNCLLLKAVAYYVDGTRSEVLTHTFFAHTQIESRFQMMLLSVSGDPARLTDAPDGILYGENIWSRGAESEREVYVEAVSPLGKSIFSQAAGVRPYGGASRKSALKSMKLFAREEYDGGNGKFRFDLFGTVGADDQIIDRYDKLVIRNSGNDLYHGFVRDELNQKLAAQAGYTGYQETLPTVVYLNGDYYGFFWLHESYCDDLLRDKFGGGNGSFQVLEGAEQSKTVDTTDPENAAAAREFNDRYNELAYSDLSSEENFIKLRDFIDVEDYLKYYAFNIYINNTDWPNNNYKVYRYYAQDGKSYGENELDGRWRVLYHDMDYVYGIYAQERSAPSRNTLQGVLTEGHIRYSPLFANLMKREDCRAYFLEEIIRLKDDVLSAENIIGTLDNINRECAYEIQRFYQAMYPGETMKRERESAYATHLESMELIREFARTRESYVEAHLIEAFGLPHDYFT